MALTIGLLCERFHRTQYIVLLRIVEHIIQQFCKCSTSLECSAIKCYSSAVSNRLGAQCRPQQLRVVDALNRYIRPTRDARQRRRSSAHADDCPVAKNFGLRPLSTITQDIQREIIHRAIAHHRAAYIETRFIWSQEPVDHAD